MSTSTQAASLLVEAHERSRNVAAEASLLASVLLDPEESLAQGLDEVRPDVFTTPLHREVWREIAETRRRGEQIDFGLIGQRLVGRVNSIDYAKLSDLVPSAASFRDRLDACIGSFRKTVLVTGAAKVLQLALDRTSRADDLEQAWETAASTARSAVLSRNAQSIGEILPEVLAQVRERSAGAPSDRIATGLYDLDRMFDGGLAPEGMHILAARPSVGKTTLALVIAWHVAGLGEPVLFITLEMSARELGAKVLSNAATFRSHALRGGITLDPTHLGELSAVAEREGGRPLFFAEPRANLSSVLSTARQEVARRGVRLVILDYLQLVEGDRPQENRYEQVSAISRQLKQLARSLGIPLLVLAQLNRQPESKKGLLPLMSHLRDSGSIEQDADSVMLLNWPWKSDSKKPRDAVDLIVAKNRHGPIGTIKLRFEPEYSRFSSNGEALGLGSLA